MLISEAEVVEGLLTRYCYDTECDEYDCIIIYLHGFPDLSVNHENPTDRFASRMPTKLNEFVRLSFATVFVCFNFSGCPGSDSILAFQDKTISHEVQDSIKMIRHVQRKFQCSKVHVIGLSTGAIVAALLRNRLEDLKSISVIAGILEIENTIQYDFSSEQLADFHNKGYCMKEFYLPNAEKVYYRLNSTYIEDCRKLDIQFSVVEGLVPFLVIHGTEDSNVPLANGQALFATASNPKEWLELKKANHLVTNSKHMKKLCNHLRMFVQKCNE